MMSRPRIVSENEVIETNPKKRKALQQGQAWGPDQWQPSKRQKPLKEAVIRFALENKMSSEDFVEYFRKDIAPDLDTEIQKQAEALERSKQEFEERKALEALPENAILSVYFGRRAYPDRFNKIINEYSLEAFIEVRDLVAQGKLFHRFVAAGADVNEFLTWINTVINQKQESENVSTNEVKETQNTLKRLIHLFRGH